MTDAAIGDATPWIRVLTLNAHQGFHAHRRRETLLRIRDALRRSHADLVFLQEIGAAAGPDSASHQYEVLADGVWRQYAYGRNAVATGGHHGNAVLSKFPIATWRNVDASVGKAEPRGLLYAVIELPGAREPLHTICLHLALRESHRRRQVTRLLTFLAEEIPRGAPIVVAGDFNDWRALAHRRLVTEGGLTEVHATITGRPARTFPARAPWLRLDRIYVRNLEHRPVAIRARAWSKLSDHLPLAGECRPIRPRSP
ncbi:MAG TPA: endonuclease/exonuclease/phosphatase family protein [Steroidobacteraceae bacterium]|nr:endonuclease/exonuclease/phosphatase family protein [Steroidobacteraceae bacterium]